MAAFCTSCGTSLDESQAFCHSCGARAKNPQKVANQETPSTANWEKVFMPNTGGVSVTNTRLVVFNKTYALANVSSVSLEKRNPHHFAGILLIVFGIFATIGGIGDPSGNGGWLLGGVAGLIIGVLLVRLKEYIVRLRTAGGESDALKTSNREFARQVVQATEEAIVSRG